METTTGILTKAETPYAPLVIAAAAQTASGVGLSVLAQNFDFKTPIRVHHAGADFEVVTTTLPGEISLIYAIVAINLIGVPWPTFFAIAWAAKQNTANKKGNRWGKVVWNHYASEVHQASNRYRWLEYILCWPLAIMVAAIALGVNDFFALLAHMVLAAATVVIAYVQDREAGVLKKDKWLPLSSACGVSLCQWMLLVWYGTVHGSTITSWMPAVTLMVASGALFVMQFINSRYKRLFGEIHINEDAREIALVSISLATKLLFSGFVILFIWEH